DKSRPEQKPRPAPVITTTRTASSRAASSIARGSSSARRGFTAFSRSGLFSVIVRTPVLEVTINRWSYDMMAEFAKERVRDGGAADSGTEDECPRRRVRGIEIGRRGVEEMWRGQMSSARSRRDSTHECNEADDMCERSPPS